MIRLSEGCPHRCPWCYEWREIGDNWKIFEMPEIVRNEVRITDMNLLAKNEALEIIRKFKDIRVNNRIVKPWFVCGIDYRFLNKEISDALKESHFINIHIAWDWHLRDQKKIKKAIEILRSSGHRNLSVFMVCNHPAVTYDMNMAKLNMCKYWNIKVNDCYYDNQISPNIKPIGWSDSQITSFRYNVRKHNQIVNFKIDPELNPIKKREISHHQKKIT